MYLALGKPPICVLQQVEYWMVFIEKDIVLLPFYLLKSGALLGSDDIGL
jgi:hypothetical protein